MNDEQKERFAELERLNESHPTWKGVPVAIIGLEHQDGVLKRCYLRKLNGRSNAWEGWVPLGQIAQQQEGPGEE